MPATMEQCKLEAKTFDHLKGLDGISAEQLEQHFKLYQGYVNNVNILFEKFRGFAENGQVGTPEYAELKRRFGFEINGVVLHDLYFNNMKPNGGALPKDSKLAKALTECYGSVENWEADFKATGKMRGIGWVIMYQCPVSGKLINCWVSDHENGHPAGFNPVMVMDVWEHAFTVDYKPTEKPNYIDAFFKNIHWEAVEARLK